MATVAHGLTVVMVRATWGCAQCSPFLGQSSPKASAVRVSEGLTAAGPRRGPGSVSLGGTRGSNTVPRVLAGVAGPFAYGGKAQAGIRRCAAARFTATRSY